ncbi:MAG: YabP/YqfC family sporulation protein [Coprococcus sp.]
MGETNRTRTHRLSLEDRKILSMTGITKVISIEPELVMAVSELGKIRITGKELQATNLDMDKGILDISGSISCLCYLGDKQNGQFSLKRMFK